MGHLIGYARISTTDQDLALQLDALKAAGCKRIYEDTASGALKSRPELDKCLGNLLPGDTLVVWKLDRLGRSTLHLVQTLDDLRKAGIGFRSLTEGMDTTTAMGEFIYTVIAAFANLERSIIRERTNAGLAAARARGRVGGRPAKATPDKIAVAQRLYDDGDKTLNEIAKIVGLSRATLYNHLSTKEVSG